jgi:hypothetical protein
MDINNDPEKEHRVVYLTISTNKFLTLCFFSLNLYILWWSYKTWRFFKEREELDIMPALRALFTIIFMIPLFEKIKALSYNDDAEPKYNSVLLFLGVLVFNLLGYLPKPFNLVSIFASVFFVFPFEAFQKGIEATGDYQVKEQEGFNSNQVYILGIGGLFWVMMIYGLFVETPQSV